MKYTDFAGSVSRGSPWSSWPDSMTKTVTSGFCVSLFATVKPNRKIDLLLNWQHSGIFYSPAVPPPTIT